MKTINLTLKIWRQATPNDSGHFETYQAEDVDTDMSFLEMLGMVNDQLVTEGKLPVAFDQDCLEGVCGTCGAMVNGVPHGPRKATSLCQLHIRHFRDGEVLVIEPFRSEAFPIIKDLVVDRGAFDRIIAAGGYISIRTGSAPEANFMPIPREIAEEAMDAAICIGCGACVAACPNASAMLFTAARVSHLALMPQGHPERKKRVKDMLAQHDREGFGGCSNQYQCEAACPKAISIGHIARLNREYLRALLG